MKIFSCVTIAALSVICLAGPLKAHEREEPSPGELAGYMIVDASKDTHEILELLRRLEKGDNVRAINLLQEILKADRMELVRLKGNPEISESDRQMAERGIHRADEYLKNFPKNRENRIAINIFSAQMEER